MTRRVDVPAARLERWVAGFAVNHPVTAATVTPDTLELRSSDGSAASLQAPFPPWLPAGPPGGLDAVDADHAARDDRPEQSDHDVRPDGADDAVRLAAALAAHATGPRTVAVLVVRRGGYAVAVVDGGRVGASKVGRRHVQGRTAAGGWSQQRFARRREKQTDELTGAAVLAAARVLAGPWPAGESWLVTGGDRPLVERVLADGAVRAVAGLPRGRHLAVGDPGARLVRDLPDLLTRVPVTLTDPAPA